MHRGLKSIIVSIGLTLTLCTVHLNAQLLQDSITLNLVKKETDYIYNLQFKNAHELYTKIVAAYPGHPIVYLLKGMITYWENYPLLSNSPYHVSYEEDMHQCIKSAEAGTNHAHEAEYLLANLCARGMLLMYYDDNDLVMDVTPLTISTYKHLRHAFDFTRECIDLYYFTGTYNYYREAYPKFYPAYRSLAFLFPHGDLNTGLEQLKTAAINSVVLRAESSYLLSLIYLSFENNYNESFNYSKSLHEKYPENLLYFEIYLRNLMLLKRYDETDKIISRLPDENGNKYFQAQLIILKGILQEKKFHNNDLARKYYNKGIDDISSFGKYGNEYKAYAYFGLSRTVDNSDEKHPRKMYRKKALKLADFKKINFDK